MSVAEIIQELPKLTPEERSAVRRRLWELDNSDGMLFLHESTDAMFQDIDKMQINPAFRK